MSDDAAIDRASIKHAYKRAAGRASHGDVRELRRIAPSTRRWRASRCHVFSASQDELGATDCH